VARGGEDHAVTHRIATLSLGALCALTAACDNGGTSRTVGITATGVVRGVTYFDANGSGTFDAGDAPLAGVRVLLLSHLGTDTLARVSSLSDGTYRLTSVPVGAYRVAVDAASVGDSVEVLITSAQAPIVRPDAESVVDLRIGYPSRTTRSARTSPLGLRVFIEGIALHGRTVFSDTVMHFVDSAGALRATRVRPTGVAAGDSVRIRGRIAVRDGQRVLDDVTVFSVGQGIIPTIPTVTALRASTADGGTLDAALVQINNVVIADTATRGGNVVLTVGDASGLLAVVLDRAADGAFRPSASMWIPGRTFRVQGVLVPDEQGAWVLRPRSALDVLSIP
jgi:hypothetical protein